MPIPGKRDRSGLSRQTAIEGSGVPDIKLHVDSEVVENSRDRLKCVDRGLGSMPGHKQTEDSDISPDVEYAGVGLEGNPMSQVTLALEDFAIQKVGLSLILKPDQHAVGEFVQPAFCQIAGLPEAGHL